MSEIVLAQAAPGGGVAEAVVFWIFAVLGVGAAIAMITLRNILHAALMLVLNLLAIGVLYLGLQSGFLAAIQIIVYAGAIMVLFLFVIMLLGYDRDDLFETARVNRVAAVVGTAALAALLLVAFVGPYTSPASLCGGVQPPVGAEAVGCAGLGETLAATDSGSVGLLAERMFNRYTFAFEASALLLVVATLGALVLGRRTDPRPHEDPAYAPSGTSPAPEPEPAGEPAAGVSAHASSERGSSPSGGGTSRREPGSDGDGGSTTPQGSSPSGGGTRHSESGRSADGGGER